MSLRYGLLGFLSKQEMSGYDLEKTFRNSIGFFWSAKISQVYRELHAMEKVGWLNSHSIIQTDKPNKKIFSITDIGRKEFEDWLINYKVQGDFENRVGILMRMYFSAGRPKEETIKLLDQFRNNCGQAINILENIDDELKLCDPKPNEIMDLLCAKATVSYGEKYYRMQMEWCKETIEWLKT